MSVKTLCQSYFFKSSTIHQKRSNILFEAAWSLIKGARLTCTDLGRYLEGKAQVKHKIKAMDRLLNNKHLQAEYHQIYQELTYSLLKNLPELFISVDWSGCCGNEFHMLRATLQYDGRAITLYNEIHPQETVGNAKVHKQFLNQLKALLPPDSLVTIITDAGFATPWFYEVLKLNWHYVGRINRKTKVKMDEDDEQSWVDTVELGTYATQRPKWMGTGLIGKQSSTPVIGNIYVYKALSQGRKDKSRYPDNNKRYAKTNKVAWIIVTSLDTEEYKARQVINIYKKRMQIEQNFRDDKNTRFGLGWRLSFTKSASRMSVLLLIATIAAFFLWWLGLNAEINNLHYQYQANTIKKRRVLSFAFLARQIVRGNDVLPFYTCFTNTFKKISTSYLRTILWAD